MTEDSAEPLLTPAEVAQLFRVDPKTVTRWATTGRLRSLRTPGGHRRYRESDVRALLAELTTTAKESEEQGDPPTHRPQ
jgi:excisionase family DNA binding protein